MKDIIFGLACALTALLGYTTADYWKGSGCRTIAKNAQIETVFVKQNKTCYIVEKNGTLTPIKTVEWKVNVDETP